MIGRILGLFEKFCYVGYTATLFANIFINPESYDDDVRGELFPRDFIYNDEILIKIDRALGERAVHAIKLEDFHRWYAEAKKPKTEGQPERITKAHNLIRMLRRLFSYGIMAELQGCKRVHEILEQAQFKAAPRRRTVLNFGHV